MLFVLKQTNRKGFPFTGFFFFKCHFVIYLNFLETDSYLTLFCQLEFKLTNNFWKNWAILGTQQRETQKC